MKPAADSPTNLIPAALGILAAIVLCGSASLTAAAEYRAFWVDTWGAGILKQSQVDALLGAAGTTNKGQLRDVNCNAVIIEVRRNCDACYPSSMGEPYMSGLTPTNFNALQAVLDAAHDTTGGKKRIEVHCWMVTFRTSGGAVYKRHNDTPTGSLISLDNYWPSRDDTGAEVDDKAFDPGHPLVLQYTVGVAMDLVNNFDIDGIHYDYIRFTANDQGYNPTSIARYNARYGLNGQPSPSDEQFKQWRRDQVSAVVRQVYARIQKSKPWVKQSGSFVTWNPSPTASTRAAFQATRPYYDVYSDWDSWIQEGIVDMAVPMTYYNWASLPNDYTKWMNFEKDRHGSRHMIIGPGIYLNSLSNAISELLMTRNPSPNTNYAHGFSGYSYRVPYVNGTWAGFSPSLVSQVTPTWADIPDMPWKSAPTTGHLMGTVTNADTGAWVDGATVSISGPISRTMYVDGTGFYAFIDLPSGSYAVTASKSGFPDAQANVTVAVGVVTGNMYEHDFALGAVSPAIISQPQNLSLLPAQTATFSVTAAGSFPLSYQWWFNGTILTGETSRTLTIPTALAANAGAYSVIVANRFGSVCSTNARLVIMPATASGDNFFGQRDIPELVTNAIAIAAGARHNLALRADGAVVAWGDNASGQCDVPLWLADAVAIAAGAYHGLAIRANGAVVPWGANDYGQTDVPADLGNVIGIAAGTWHSLALRPDGSVAAWGDNLFGQTDLPASLTNVTAIAAGGNHSLALKADGTVVAWGENTDADGYVVDQSVVPRGLSNVVAIAAGEYHSLAVKQDGTVVAWGDNSHEQLSLPSGLTNVVAVAAGGAHSLALRADGSLAAWGADGNGQCYIPTGLCPSVAVAAGSSHTLLLLENMIPVPQLLNPALNGHRFSTLVQTLNRKCYALEFKDSMDATNWFCICTNTGNGALRVLADPTATGARRFYRMQQW
jgi:uncharacterized lipoprotein YddW (UPF0748 family)